MSPDTAPPNVTLPIWKRPQMLRLVVGLFAFAVLVCALIVAKPLTERTNGASYLSGGALSGVDVTRTDGLISSPEETEAVRAAMIAYRESLPQADEMMPAPVSATPLANRLASQSTFGFATPVAIVTHVVISNTADAPEEVAAPLPDVPTAEPLQIAVPETSPAILSDETSLGDTTAAVLAGLGLITATQGGAASDPLHDLSAGTLSGIRSVTGDAAAAPRTALQALVVDALAAGQSDDDIDALLNEAAAAGRISVPEILVTTDGRVDTAVLLASIVSDARVAQGGAAPIAPTSVGGEGVEVRVVQTATETESYRFYTVSSGDSLGAIAVKFYGDIRYYDLVYQANRDILASPDRIMVGQRLVIPDLPVT